MQAYTRTAGKRGTSKNRGKGIDSIYSNKMETMDDYGGMMTGELGGGSGSLNGSGSGSGESLVKSGIYGDNEASSILYQQSKKLTVRWINKLPPILRDGAYFMTRMMGLFIMVFFILPIMFGLWFLSFVDYFFFDTTSLLPYFGKLAELMDRNVNQNYDKYQPNDRPPLWDLNYMIFSNFDLNAIGVDLISSLKLIIQGIMMSVLLIVGRLLMNGFAQRYFGKLRLMLIQMPSKYRENVIYMLFDKILHLWHTIEFVYYVTASSKNEGRKYVLGNWSNYGNIFAAGYPTNGMNNNSEDTIYTPFMTGIGILDYDKCKRLIQSNKTHKTNNIFHLEAPLVQQTYHPFSTIQFDTNSNLHTISRDVMWIFINESFIMKNYDKREFNVQLQNIAKLQTNDKVDDVNRAAIKGVFYSIFGIKLNNEDSLDVLQALENGWRNGISPSWMNFLLNGWNDEYKLELLINNTMNNIILPRLSKNIIDQLYNYYYNNLQNNNEWQFSNDADLSVYFMINNFFLTIFAASMGGIMSLANVNVSKIRENPREYVPLYKENNIRFMLECARMETLPSGCTIQLTENEFLNIGGKIRNIPKDTLCTLFINVCNNDPNKFYQPLTFNPQRKDLFNMLNFNAFENDMNPLQFNVVRNTMSSSKVSRNKNSKNPRSCPGHDISLIIVKNMLSSFVMDERESMQRDLIRYENYDEDRMEVISRKVPKEAMMMLTGAKTFLDTWIRLSVESIGIPTVAPYTLKKIDVIPGVSLPEVDEDISKALQDVGGIFLSDTVLNGMAIKDYSYQFSNEMEGGEFREWFFDKEKTLWPPINVDWKDMTSDNAQSLIAFYGAPAYLTRRAGNDDYAYVGNNASIVVGNVNSDNNDSGNGNAGSGGDGAAPAAAAQPVSEELKSESVGINDDAAMVDDDDENDDDYDKDDIYWVCESQELSTFPTRDDGEFMRLGASAYFNVNRELVGIYCCDDKKYYGINTTDNEKWMHLKWLWRCSVLVKMTLHEHLINCHFKFALGLDIASRETLSCNHPLRRLLKPFMFRTTYVNWLAYKQLINEFGLVHRGFCYNYDTLVNILNGCMDMWEFELVEDHFKNNGFTEEELNDEDAPVFYDACKLYEIHKNKLVAPYINVYYKTDDSILQDKELNAFLNLFLDTIEFDKHNNIFNYQREYFTSNKNGVIDLITQIISTVTGLHEVLGNFVEFKMRPTGYCGKVRRDTTDNMADIQSYCQLLTLGAFTGGKTPQLLNNFSRLLLEDEYYNENVEILNSWQSTLFLFRDEINLKNKTRRIQPCNSFNPTYLECSVSI